MANQYYWIDALAPLVFRSGKPFGAQSDTEDIVFPLPSVAAGLIRTVWAQQQNHFTGNFTGEFDSENLKQIPSNGLFLAQKDGSDNLKLFAPKPADVIYLKNKKTNQVEIVRLSPKEIGNSDDCGCDLHNDLWLVQMDDNRKGKPQSGKQFWLLSDYLAWLNGENISFEQVEKNGATLPAIEVRTHVAIDGATGTSQDGLLFQTAAYDFANPKKNHHKGWHDTQMGFVIASECDLKKETDLVRFGGEGRLSYLCKTELVENPFRPSEIRGNRIKLTLLTPAIFGNGWLPKWLNDDLTGTLPHTSLKVKLKAAAVERWQPVSGWDLANHRPKPMRKAVSAGAIYWLEIQNHQDFDIQKELQKLAYQSVCDDEQDQRDGFGIVAVSEWKK